MPHVLAKDLRDAVLQAAIQGKLTERLGHDTPVDISIKKALTEKEKLIEERVIQKEKAYSKSPKYTEYPFDIPEEWCWIRFGELTINKDSKRIPVSKAEREKKKKIYDYYGASGAIDKIDDYLFDETNMLIGEDGANLLLRSTPIAFFAVGKYWVNNHAHVLNVCGDISLKYICLYINAIDLSPYVTGTAQPKMNQENMNAIWVPLPSVEEQARIVTKVDELMAKIDEYEKLENELVELQNKFPGEMKDAILQAAMQGKLTNNINECDDFDDLDISKEEYDYDLPDGWGLCHLGSVSNVYTGNSIPEAVKKAKYMNVKDGRYYIGTKDVSFDSVIDYDNGVKIPFDEEKFKIAKKDATLLCIEGGSAGKKIGMINQDVCFGNKLCSFNPKNEFDPKYLYHYLQSPMFKRNFYDNLSGMIGGVSVNKLKEIVIPCPSKEEQHMIVELLDKLIPLCDGLKEVVA